jgi:ABC-type sugar transport system permease subunit
MAEYRSDQAGVLQGGSGLQQGLGSATLPRPRRRRHWRRALIPYLFIAPFIAFFFIFNVYPDGYALVLSFYRYRGYGAMRYIAWDNYSAILHYHVFWTELQNTIFYWLAHAIPLIPLSFLLALLVRSKLIRGQRFIKPIIFMPQVIAIVAATLVFQNLFSTQYGAINSIFHTKIEWLQNYDIARWIIVVLLIWRGLGFWFVVFLAGLTSINPELEEAAIVDGASTWDRTIYLIVPLLRNVFLFAFVIDAINSMALFTEPNILTAGPNIADPHVAPMLTLLVSNMNDGDFGQAAATGWLLFAVTLVISVAQFLVFRSSEGAVE